MSFNSGRCQICRKTTVRLRKPHDHRLIRAHDQPVRKANVVPFHPVNPNYDAIKAGLDVRARAQDAREPLDTTPDVQPQTPTAPVK